MHKINVDHMLGRGGQDIRLNRFLLPIAGIRGKRKCDSGRSNAIFVTSFSTASSGVRLVRLLHGSTDVPHVMPGDRRWYHPGDGPVKDSSSSSNYCVLPRMERRNSVKGLGVRVPETQRFLGWRTRAEWLVLYAVRDVTCLGK